MFDATATPSPVHPLLIAPVAPTLAKLAAPNLLGMMATTAVSIAETAYIGRLGAEALAAAALVLPLIMLMGMIVPVPWAGGFPRPSVGRLARETRSEGIWSPKARL